jgi:NADH:ubiquinone oxidoreductase subunit 6 (subunit J)
MWIQIVAALFLAGAAIAEASGLKSPTFDFSTGWLIFVLAGAVMAFEAWRTWRRTKSETN